MKKAKTTNLDSQISITRQAEETVKIDFVEGKTVEYYLDEANIELASAEDLYVEAMLATLKDELEAGDLLQIVVKKGAASL